MPPVITRCAYLAGEHLGIGAGVGMRRAIGVAFERDRRHADDGRLGELLLQLVILRLAFGKTEPPAVIVDHDRDVIGIVEGSGAALEGGVVEAPLRRGELPDQPGEIARVFLVAGAAALGGEVILVPPLQLGLRRQRRHAELLVADEIAAHRYHRLAALRPQCGDDVGGAGTPVAAADRGLLDAQRIHQGDDIGGDRRLLAVADRLVRQESRRAVAAQIRHDHAIPLRGEQGRDTPKRCDAPVPCGD